MASDTGQPRLLIASRNLATLRGHYEDVIVGLARAGVRVTIRYRNDKGLTAVDYRRMLAQRGCSVPVEPLGRLWIDAGDLFAVRLRQLENLLRFYGPAYRQRAAALLQARLEKAPAGPRRWAIRLGRLGGGVSSVAVRVAAAVDRLLPPSARARELISSERPDAVVAVDIDRVPELVDALKAAARERVRTAIWIQSWDNLTSKGFLHFTPDRIFVWNETQRDELARHHKVDPARVCVTGAQTFDHWFNGDAPSDRADFCSRNGLAPERPIILYLASSRLAEDSPEEFFLRWLEAVRASDDPALGSATVLVRPHPTNVEPWQSLADIPSLAVSPCTAEAPINSPEFRRRYRDELHHASVAVGLNTSGMIDAAIFGKPVCTVELPELKKGQRGMMHFEYLMTVGGGFLRTASSLEEHVSALSELIGRDPYEHDAQAARFVRDFIRPHGLDVTPAEVFAREMLGVLESPAEPHAPGRLGRAIGRGLRGAAPVLGLPLAEEPLPSWLLERVRSFPGKLQAAMRSLQRGSKGMRRAARKAGRKYRARQRAHLKPIRRFFLVRLRAALGRRLAPLFPTRRRHDSDPGRGEPATTDTGDSSQAKRAVTSKPPTGKQRQLEATVKALLDGSDRRIIAGPWLGEVGWEVLYWIPLLRWCVHCWPELRERLVIVSRGGVAGWYEGIAEAYVDLSEAFDEKTFSRRVEEERATRKARGLKSNAAYEETEWEREIAEWVSEKLGEQRMPMLHPSHLYRLKKLMLWLADSEDGSFMRWQRPDPGPLRALLPESYVAVRFYTNGLLTTNQAEVAAFTEAATRSLAEKMPVVMLKPGMEIDLEHSDFTFSGDNVIPLAPYMSFENNLAIQSIAIAHAKAFVGTYGGLSFVAPHYGVPSVSFWSTTRYGSPGNPETNAWDDLYIARDVFNRPGWGGYTARWINDAPLDELLAPALAS